MKALAIGLATILVAAPITPALAQDVPDDARPTVAVLRFDNDTGEERYEHLGRAFSSMMISDLSVLEQIRLVERERLEEILAELELQNSAYADSTAAQSVGMILGAEYVVVGSFVAVAPAMRMDSRVARVETAEIVATANVRGEQETLFDLQQRLAEQVIEGLSLVLSKEDRARLRERQEANRIDDLEAALAYARALCLMDHGAYPEALDALETARSRAPASGLVGSALALARRQAADEARDRARSEANRRLGNLTGGRVRIPGRSARRHPC